MDQHNTYTVFDMGSEVIERGTDYPSLKQHWENECRELGLAVFIMETGPNGSFHGEVVIGA